MELGGRDRCVVLMVVWVGLENKVWFLIRIGLFKFFFSWKFGFRVYVREFGRLG